MKYYYLTDDSAKSLAPFFSKIVLSATFLSVIIIIAVMMVFWPRQPLSSFIVAETVPHTSFLIFIATLIVYSYVNLCCGCGDMIQRSYHITHLTDISTFEKENGFFQYGLFQFLLHTLILLLPFIPLLKKPWSKILPDPLSSETARTISPDSSIISCSISHISLYSSGAEVICV